MGVPALVLYPLVAVLLLLIPYCWLLYKYRAGRSIPGPPQIPILGHLHYLFGCNSLEQILKTLVEVAKQYDYFLKLNIGPQLMVYVSQPKYIEALLPNIYATKKPFFYRYFENIIGGVFNADGKNWQEMRKIVTVSFYKKHLETYFDIFNEKAEKLVIKLKSKENFFLDPTELMSNALLDISIRTIYGVECNLLDTETTLMKEVLESISVGISRLSNPFYFLDFFYFFSPGYWRSEKLIQPFKKFLTKKILERKEKRKVEEALQDSDPNKKRGVYLDQIADWSKEKGLTDPKHLIPLTSDMVAAAVETTTTLLCWVLFYLAKREDWQKKIYDEFSSVVGDGPVTSDHVTKLSTYDMFVNEILRLYSPPLTARLAQNNIPLDDHVIPEGAIILLCSYGVHRNPEYWERPNEFYPEHFLPEAVAKRPKYSFVPFSAGPRKCPGGMYSNWVTKVMLWSILKNYRIETDVSEKDLKLKILVLISPEDGFTFKFIPRH